MYTNDSSNSMPLECYSILGLKSDATKSEIRKAYRKVSKEYHPDRNSDPAAKPFFDKITLANDVLSDPKKRKDYDFYLENPNNVIKQGLRYYKASFATRTDPRVVVIGFLAFISAAHYHMLKKNHRDAIEYIKKNNKDIRRQAKEIARQRAEKFMSSKVGGKKAKSQLKTKLAEFEDEAADELARSVKIEGSCREPTVYDMLMVRLALWPYNAVIGAMMPKDDKTKTA
jgi:DnaJ-class molecular chaperone